MKSRSRTLRAFGRKEVWGWQLFWFALPFYATASLLFDVVLLNNASLLWLLIFVGSTAAMVLVAVLCKKFFMDALLDRTGSGWASIALAAVLGAVKNSTVAALSIALGLQQDVDWAFRFIGGAGLAIPIFACYVLVLGTRVEHRAAMAKLTRTQNDLLAFKAQSKSVIAAENAKLLKETQDEILPKLQKIQTMLVAGTGLSESAAQLRSLISDQIRPISQRLGEFSERPAFATTGEITTRPPKLFENAVSLRQLIAPNIVFLISAPSYWLTIDMIISFEAALKITPYIPAVWLLMHLSRLALPVRFKTNRNTSWFLLISIGIVSSMPVYLGFLSLAQTPTQVNLGFMEIFGTVAALTGFATSKSRDIERQKAEAQLAKDNEILQRELALFDQKLWVARRNWNFIIHGTVQSALTAAVTRLVSAGQEAEPYQLELVKQDIERARGALISPTQLDISIQSATAQIVDTWRGVCNVEFVFSARASRAIERDLGVRQCINEIAKEVVSNAVRHGSAKTVRFTIDRSEDELIELTAVNDGNPVPTEAPEGVGSQMLNELTLDWNIQNRAGSGVVFRASLPLSQFSVVDF
ncbi:MAG: hypothetical protein RLZZ258_57 [Actinomycetota bacterium]|jgi:hypothetical protein